MKKVKFIAVIGFIVLCIFAFTTCNAEETISKTAPAGVYVGVVSFNAATLYPVNNLVAMANASNTLTSNSLVYLNATSKETLKTNVMNKYVAGSTNNTPVVYAVDSVITELKRFEGYLSSKLDNVTIITFTDGYDQASADYKGGTNETAYFTAVKNKIDTTKIKNVPINAYAVAVADSANTADQNKTLQAISSGSSGNFNIITVSDWSANLASIFTDIANSLTSIRYIGSLTITISGPSSVASYTSGDNFCITFDGANPTNSNSKITGKVVESSGKYSITNLSKTNVNFSATEAKESGRWGVNVSFGIPGVTGTVGNNMKQWKYDGSNWTQLEGGNAGGWSYAKTEQKSAIIYLVLDATLSSANITTIKNAIANNNGFIDILYNNSKQQ